VGGAGVLPKILQETYCSEPFAVDLMVVVIFVGRPELPVPLFSYLLFELKQALDCFGTVSFWAGSWCTQKVLQEHTVQDLC
jgi:hypothetical protein